MPTQILGEIKKAEEDAKALIASAHEQARQTMTQAREAADKEAADVRAKAEADAAERIKEETARAQMQAGTVQEDGKKRLDAIHQTTSNKVDEAVARALKKLLA